MAFDDLIWKIWEIEEEIREKQLEEEELKRQLEELKSTLRKSRGSQKKTGETVDNVDLSGAPYMVVDGVVYPWSYLLAGEIHSRIMDKVLHWRKETAGEFSSTVHKALEILKAKGFITENDYKMLLSIIEPNAGFKEVQAICQKILDGNEASHLASAIASLASRSFLDSMNIAKGDQKKARGIATNDVGGAIGGAAVGAKWGWIGALVGAIVGGAAMSIATAIDEDNNSNGG